MPTPPPTDRRYASKGRGAGRGPFGRDSGSFGTPVHFDNQTCRIRATKHLIQLGLTRAVADDKSCRKCTRLSRNVRLSNPPRTPIDYPLETVTYVRIWTPPHFASTPSSGDEVRLLTYIGPPSDLDQPRSGHDGLCARRLLIALPGFSPVDIPRLFRRRFDLFAIFRSARNRGDVLLDQLERTASGRHALRFIVRSMPQHRPGDPGGLVGERRHSDVRV
jgi:hypothetical protein